MPNFYDAVYRLARDIPRGRGMTYGQNATILGTPRAARAVGYALQACPGGVPWQRVINARGRISGHGDRVIIQRELLEGEGIMFEEDACNLDAYRWEPSEPEVYAFEEPGDE